MRSVRNSIHTVENEKSSYTLFNESIIILREKSLIFYRKLFLMPACTVSPTILFTRTFNCTSAIVAHTPHLHT
jgi:hypothetical protein